MGVECTNDPPIDNCVVTGAAAIGIPNVCMGELACKAAVPKPGGSKTGIKALSSSWYISRILDEFVEAKGGPPCRFAGYVRGGSTPSEIGSIRLIPILLRVKTHRMRAEVPHKRQMSRLEFVGHLRVYSVQSYASPKGLRSC